jgi:hypothetical protein
MSLKMNIKHTDLKSHIGSTPGIRGERSAANCLSHGTVIDEG